MKLKLLNKLLYLMGAIAAGTVSLSFFAASDGLSGVALDVWEFFGTMAAILTLVFMLLFSLDT